MAEKMPIPPEVADYLSRCRRDEQVVVAPRRSVAQPASLTFLLLHTRQFFWTIRRAVGLDPQRWKTWWRRRQRSRQLLRRRHLLPAPVVAGQRAPRVLIDVTHAAISPLATGIQRVVRECAREAVATGAACPVVVDAGRMTEAYGPARGHLPVAPGDILLLLDSSWDRLPDLAALAAEIKAHAGRVVGCIYDLIPIGYPTACAAEHVAQFESWLRQVLPLCDALVTISDAVAAELRRLPDAATLPIAVFPLGCDPATPSVETPRRETIAAFATGPAFLSVGTIEPRKGYPIALDAFETLWSRGSPATYVILGRTGWSMRHFEQRILRHPEYGRRLFWLRNAGDGDLAYAYRHARALIAPSIAEGFGLPIVEAARAGVPVVLSDIDVFREIGAYARSSYFAVADSHDLAHRIEELVADPQDPTPAKRPIPSWRETTEIVTRMVRSPILYRDTGRCLTIADFEPH